VYTSVTTDYRNSVVTKALGRAFAADASEDR
jgi:hypothetical protein